MGAKDVLGGLVASMEEIQPDHPELDECSQENAADVVEVTVDEVADSA
jgi:hypothetical protein